MSTQRAWRLLKESRDDKYKSIPFTTNIQDYELLSPIGGVDDMSYMYLSRFRPTGDLVTLKYTDLTISPDMEFLEELITVIWNSSKHRHPSLLPYYMSFIENERLWTVTLPMKAEYFPNGFSESSVSTIIKEVLRGLSYLHSQGIVHNDVRADNVLLDTNGDIRLTGFHQLTRVRQDPQECVSTGDFFAQPEWVAPECLEQNERHNEKADIYSLGIMALELAFGRTPYGDWPPLKIIVAKLQYECPIDSIVPEEGTKKAFSRHFFHFVRYCVQYNPARRPSAASLQQHPFMKLSKGKSYLRTKLVKRSGLIHKHADVLSASPAPPSATSASSSSSPSSPVSPAAPHPPPESMSEEDVEMSPASHTSSSIRA
ncbi:hypothetical protein RI367_008233 [Sorochytrium milnesiophthora]